MTTYSPKRGLGSAVVFSMASFAAMHVWTTAMVYGLAHAQPQQRSSVTKSPLPSATPSSSCLEPQFRQDVNISKLKEKTASGRVFQPLNFLSEREVEQLWQEIRDLEDQGGFSRSGLSNTVKGEEQGFGDRDRRLCPVPWWTESLQGVPKLCTATTATIASRIQDLRHVLAQALGRHTMADANLQHECYYSMSSVGSLLPRHMDERHEELKGAKGWLLPSRRSLSWLIYLSDPAEWNLSHHGGALRTFPQAKILDAGSLTHDHGNLQIGWLLKPSSNRDDNGSDNQGELFASQPVYLDSWFPVPSQQPGEPPEPHCVLYCRDGNLSLLTKPWLSENVQGISMADFIQYWAQRQGSNIDDDDMGGLFLRRQDAQQFTLIEDRAAWDAGELPKGTVAEDTVPARGSLVVFDSVILPHQVETIHQGRRVAMAGWFHEATQSFPEDLFT